MDEYARFAFLYDRVVGAPLRPVHASMLATIAAHGCRTLADLCCGTGLLCGLARSAGLLPSGVDISPDMLAAARRKHPSIKFLESDATATPYPDHAFDAAAVSFALHEKSAEAAHKILAEAMRITRPGGVLAVGDYRVPDGNRYNLTGMGIGMVERLAGREHYACFRRYMDAGGAEARLFEAGLAPGLVSVHLNGWAGVYVAILA